tara:strand:- start:173 stop:361 length:189 start_codon:yes stop_codon:yes gene_type:complete
MSNRRVASLVVAWVLLSQMAALVCLLAAQCLSGKASQMLSLAGVLLLIQNWVLARIRRTLAR